MRVYLTTAALVAASVLTAQTSPPQENVRVFTHKIGHAGTLVAGAPADNVQFIATEFSFGGDKAVTGAPYSAEAVTETTQTLADGNKISRKNSARLYRDSEGRTRRDQTIGHIGPWASRSGFKSSIIHDPVAGQHYVLEPETKTARKLQDVILNKISLPRVAGTVASPEPGAQASVASAPGMAYPAFAEGVRIEGPSVGLRHVASGGAGPNGNAEFKSESLGTKVIEGLVAEGSKTILTIPAGQIGNERPIEVVTERWYSPELQVVVMTRNSDPRMGETVYKLTNVLRGEPGRHLFEVPADYVIQEGNVRQPQVEIMRSVDPTRSK